MIRLYSRAEFEQLIIKRFKLDSFGVETDTVELWRCPNGRCVTIPKPDGGHVSYNQHELDRAFDVVKEACSLPPISR